MYPRDSQLRLVGSKCLVRNVKTELGSLMI